MRSSVHVETVKVERCRLVTELIVRIDDDVVAYVGLDLWYRPLPVDAYDWSLEGTVGIRSCPANLEIICDNSSGYESQRGKCPC